MALAQVPSGKPVVPVAKPAAAATITVKPQSDVAGQSILLNDIAEITGADKALVTRLGAVEVGTSPLVGLSRTLLRADIVTRLRFNQIDVEKLDIVSAPSFSVTRTGADLAVPEVVEFATKTLLAARKNTTDGVQIEALPIPYKWVVPPGKREMLAGPIRGGLDGNLVTVPVTVLVDGKPSKTVEVSFKLKRLVPVLVATRQLDAHTVLKLDDFSLTTQEIGPGVVVVTDAALLIGMRTTRLIPAGGVITRNAVEGTPVVTIGAPVTVTVTFGNISVETSGVARTQGALGDRIHVFIPKTNKDIIAIVLDAKTVRLEDNG